MGLNLADAWQRIEWAERDMESLNDLVRAWIERQPYAMWAEPDGERFDMTFQRRATEQEERLVLSEHARLLGSVLDHLRASLNYLTYQAAAQSVREDPALAGKLHPDAVEFPIFNDANNYRKHSRAKALPEKHRHRIDAAQPFNGGEHANGLWMLHELSRVYRHRLVNSTFIYSYAMATPGAFHIDFPETMRDVVVSYTGGPLADGAKLYSFVPTADHAAEHHPVLVLGVGVEHAVCNGLPEVHVVNAINAAVHAVLNDWADLRV